ncbi:MAG: 4Fe-4S binding protein [Desulfovibrionales bacterium]|nr:4Fe-4S binding protein [Desulfovibrionales bacterium]
MPTEAIRSIAAKALEEKRVDLVIGFTPGATTLITQPAFIEESSAAGKLIWNDFCVSNLAKHLLRRDKKIGIIANGCTSRNIVVYIVESQIRREDIYIIGVPCQGMLDRHKIKALSGKKKIKDIRTESDRVTLSGDAFTKEYPRREILRQSCLYCRHKNPVIYDILVGEPVGRSAERRGDEDKETADQDIEVLEAQSAEERLEYFRTLFDRCKLCYACRNACPVCYCPTCFTDRTDPKWFDKPPASGDAFTFHLLRAMHSAGRCTDCGACESACPVGIPITKLTRKLNKDIRTLYNFEAGLSIETPSPLSVYDLEDPQDFILTEELKKKAKTSAS